MLSIIVLRKKIRIGKIGIGKSDLIQTLNRPRKLQSVHLYEKVLKLQNVFIAQWPLIYQKMIDFPVHNPFKGTLFQLCCHFVYGGLLLLERTNHRNCHHYSLCLLYWYHTTKPTQTRVLHNVILQWNADLQSVMNATLNMRYYSTSK